MDRGQMKDENYQLRKRKIPLPDLDAKFRTNFIIGFLKIIKVHNWVLKNAFYTKTR
jgi:hypothetical protein